MNSSITPTPEYQEVHFADGYIYDRKNSAIRHEKSPCSLDREHAAVLEVLILYRNQVVARQDIMKKLEWLKNERHLEAFIRHLRTHCFAGSESVEIRTVRMTGYSLIVADENIKFI